MLPDPDTTLVSILQTPFSYLFCRVYRGKRRSFPPDPLGSFTAPEALTRPGSPTPCLPPDRASLVTSRWPSDEAQAAMFEGSWWLLNGQIDRQGVTKQSFSVIPQLWRSEWFVPQL